MMGPFLLDNAGGGTVTWVNVPVVTPSFLGDVEEAHWAYLIPIPCRVAETAGSSSLVRIREVPTPFC